MPFYLIHVLLPLIFFASGLILDCRIVNMTSWCFFFVIALPRPASKRLTLSVFVFLGKIRQFNSSEILLYREIR